MTKGFKELSNLWDKISKDEQNRMLEELYKGVEEATELAGEGLKENSVGTLELKDKAVTGEKISEKSVGIEQLKEDSVGTLELRKDAVTKDKISDKSISNEKLEDETITSHKIKNSAISTRTIGTEQVDSRTIAKEAIISDKVKDVNILNNKIPVNELSVYSMDFLNTGKNLFNKGSITREYYANLNNGVEYPTTNYFTSKYIPMSENVNIAINVNARVLFYKKDGSYISGKENIKSLISPPETAMVKVAAPNYSLATLQVEIGTTSTSYSEFEIKSDRLKLTGENIKEKTLNFNDLSSLKTGKNLFNRDDVILDWYLNLNNGQGASYKDYVTSKEFVPMDSDEFYSLNNKCRIFFYDKDLNLINGIEPATIKSTFKSPVGTAFSKISGYKGNVMGKEFQLEKGETQTSFEEFAYYIPFLKTEKSDSNIEPPIINNEVLPKRHPSPATIPDSDVLIRKLNNYNYNISTIDSKGNIWFTDYKNSIYKTSNFIDVVKVADLASLMKTGETISLYAFLVNDNGRVVVGTNLGRILVSDFEQKIFTEKFQYVAGYSQNVWGYDQYQGIIVMSSYGSKGDNPPRQVIASFNGGETFELIFEKKIEDMRDSKDFHIHTVLYDPYSKGVIISIGDGANRNIMYSYDKGKTWSYMFDEKDYPNNKWPELHPTSLIAFPEGIAMGSDEFPEGISFWKRPKAVIQPKMSFKDVEYRAIFTESSPNGMIGTYGTKGSYLQTEDGLFGVMPFRNHRTTTEGHSRLFATGDGGRSWHEVFKAPIWTNAEAGLFNAFLKEESDGIYVYGAYTRNSEVQTFRAKLPIFYKDI